MSKKWKRLLYQLLGFVVGIIFGLLRPESTQPMLPLIGIVVGIGYFFILRITSEQEKELDDVSWFILIQMLMYFLIGSALSSSIILAMELMQ